MAESISHQYDARAIEVLTGLEPVRKRPGMYTDTTRPNHLAQEVIDNSVDEAVSGFATRIDVILHADGSLSVQDDGRGMPVDMAAVGTIPKKQTGTLLRFWPRASYFDHPKFLVSRLLHVLRAKAVLCPGLTVTFLDEASDESQTWFYENGLTDYLLNALTDRVILPPKAFVGHMSTTTAERPQAADWALVWLAEAGGEPMTESYVNLIPTPQGGTHVNGLRQGLTDAVRV
jgi:topoisomerase-4 subunit B